MSELKWDKTGFLECLGVLPETEEYETYFGYTIERKGLILLVIVRPHEGVIDLRLRRDNAEADIINFSLLVGGKVKYKRYKAGDFLLFPSCRMVADRFYYMREGGAESVTQSTLMDVEVAVDPDIMIRLGH